MSDMVSLKDARAAGLKRYFTGQPCKHGHIAERLVSTRKCCQCNAMHVVAWGAANPEKRKEYDQRWRAKNPEKARASAMNWHAANKKRVQEMISSWYASNPHVRAAKEAKRRAEKRARVPSWFGEFDAFVMREAAALARMRKAVTGMEWHVDHMIPLLARKASGLHCAANLQVIPAFLNIRKLNRLSMTKPGEWVRYV